MICTDHRAPDTPAALLPTAAISPAVNVPCPFWSIGLLLLLTKFQPIKSSGFAVSPSWVEPLDHPPELVGAITAPPVTRPPAVVGSIFPVPWLIFVPPTTAFRSASVIRPSPFVSVRSGRTLAGISAWLIQMLLSSCGLL